MDEMASFLDEAVLPASPSGALQPQTPIPEKLIFIEFHHNNVMLRDLENINNKNGVLAPCQLDIFSDCLIKLNLAASCIHRWHATFYMTRSLSVEGVSAEGSIA